jgi:integrase
VSNNRKTKPRYHKGYVTVGYDDNGKPERKYAYAPRTREGKQQLQDKLTALRMQYSKGLTEEELKLTVSQLAEKWYSLHKLEIEYNTAQSYKLLMNKHIVPDLGKLKVTEVKPYHIQELLILKGGSGLCRGTLRIIKTVAYLIFEYAISRELIQYNPVERAKLPKGSDKTRRALSKEETVAMIKACTNNEAGPMMLTLMFTGLRPGEALALNWSDIDLKNNTISVTKSLYHEKTIPKVKEKPKTQAGIRVVDIPHILSDYLKEYKTKTGARTLVFPGASGGYMIPSEYNRTTRKVIADMTKELCGHEVTASKLKLYTDIVPYSLRHTYASMLYFADVDAKALQNLMGHAKFQTAANVYIHLDKVTKNKSIQKLDQYIKKSLPPIYPLKGKRTCNKQSQTETAKTASKH